MGSWTMGWTWFWPLLLVAGLMVIGYVAVRLAQGQVAAPPPERATALRILDERLARGEIDEDEYRRRRGLLA